MEIDLPLFFAALAGIGVFVTAIATIVKLYYIDTYRPYRKRKRLEEKEELQSLKSEYERCAWSIENNIKKYVEKNESTNFKAQLSESRVVGKAEISEELKRQVQEHNEKLELYDVLCRASRKQIKSIIEKQVKEKFPKTLKERVRLDKMLQSNYLMARHFNGEKVTDSWLKEVHPKRRKEVIGVVDKSERDELDTLFHELSNEFENDVILHRFRKEKRELIELGHVILKDLKIAVEKLRKELAEYKDIKSKEKGVPEM